MNFRFREGLKIYCDEDLSGNVPTSFSGPKISLDSTFFELTGTQTNFTLTSGFIISSGVKINGSIPTTLLNNSFPVGTELDSDISANISLYTSNHIFASGRVFNAVYNDIAEFRQLQTGNNIQYGRCYVQTENGIRLSNDRLEDGIIGICSDTYGQVLGLPDLNSAPIALAGYVLAYISDGIRNILKDKDLKSIKIGTPLTSGPDGTLTIMTKSEIINNPDKIVAKYIGSNANSYLRSSCQDTLKNIENRHWVKVC